MKLSQERSYTLLGIQALIVNARPFIACKLYCTGYNQFLTANLRDLPK